MLYGRVPEFELVGELLTEAANGKAGSLVVRGEAGIGKSALLEHAADAAGRQGSRVLSVTGTEAESELAFAGLHLLLGRFRDRVGALPAAQADALRAAIDTGDPDRANRFLVGAAVLTVLADLADEQPLLCLVDDAQWLDRASLEALVFVARRLDAERLALVFAVRDNLLPELHDLAGHELALRGLEAEAAAALLADHHPELPPAAAQGVLREAQGNPLAVRVLPTMVRPDHLYASPFRTGTGSMQHRIRRAFAARVAALPTAIQELLLVIAVDDSSDPAIVLAAAAGVGADRSEVEAAEQAELVRLCDGRISFVHPLIRAAVYDEATPSRRRAAHALLAAELTGPDAADRRAWHLAAAATGPDEEIAVELDRVADRAHSRGGLAEAAAAYRRAADLSAQSRTRTPRLIAAAAAAVDIGELTAASDLVEQALSTSTDPRELATLTTLQADIARERDRPEAAYQSLSAAASFLASHDPTATGRLLFQAADAAWGCGDLTAVEQTAQRAEALGVPGADRVRALVDLVHGLNAGPGVDASDASLALRRLLDTAETDRLRERVTVVYWHLLFADIATTRDLASALAADCRQQGALGILVRALMFHARAEQILGRFTTAAALAEEGARLAAETGQRFVHVYQSTTLALLAAARGEEQRCRDFAAEPLERGIAPSNVHAAAALSLLDLGLGRPDAAVDRLSATLAGANRHGVIASIPDLVEAAYRADRLEQARVPFEWYRTWSDQMGRSWTSALTHRCQALLTAGGEAEEYFTDALRLHRADTDFSFDRARTELLYGEWLRRRQRRTDARPPLRSAAETFRHLGAVPWAERAENELRATGETRAPSPATDILGHLTPQELQIAQLAATGLSNKDIAGQLFLSPRTVGFHLSNAYPKLGIASRRELGVVFRDRL